MESITAEIGTTGEYYTLYLTGDVDGDIAAAVEAEHPCTDYDCDIRCALEAGFARAAAELLYGATETPLLEAVLAHYGISPTDICPFDSDEWRAWVTYWKEEGPHAGEDW